MLSAPLSTYIHCSSVMTLLTNIDRPTEGFLAGKSHLQAQLAIFETRIPAFVDKMKTAGLDQDTIGKLDALTEKLRTISARLLAFGD